MWSHALIHWSVAEFAVAFGLVLLGATLQVATGVGLGLIAGPSLLFFLDGSSAVLAAIILNLALTVCLLPGELGDVARRPLTQLSIWAFVGIPIGTGLLFLADTTTLKIASGVVVLLAVAQLRFAPAGPDAGERTPWWVMKVGGTLSGGMTGALAVPGPIALWTVLMSGLQPAAVRATLRAYFLVAYTAALLIHLIILRQGEGSWQVAVALLPAVGLGIGAGLFTRKAITPNRLRQFLLIVLFAMGVSLLFKGVWDAS